MCDWGLDQPSAGYCNRPFGRLPTTFPYCEDRFAERSLIELRLSAAPGLHYSPEFVQICNTSAQLRADIVSTQQFGAQTSCNRLDLIVDQIGDLSDVNSVDFVTCV